ncbi:MAG: hypothetical protein ACXWLM_03360, partial [Myxococcales bacterium]
MRASLAILVLLSSAACRTSNLGACATDAQCPGGTVCDAANAVCVVPAGACFPACDASHVCDSATQTCVAAAAPQVTITSPAPATVVGATFDATASAHAPGGVTAVGFEVRSDTGTLLASGSGTQAAADPGSWSATLSLATASDGPASLTAIATWSQGTTTSPPVALVVALDRTGPTISIAADTTPYARTAVPIPVSAFVDDPSGVPDGGVLLNGSVQAVGRDGGLFTFQLDPRSAPAGVEGTYTFQVSAVDSVGNPSGTSGTRVVDDAAPALSNLRVFKGTDPGTNGVTYPAAVPNTGWTGSSFIYSDTVHVKGTLTDLSGIGAASLHVDGLDLGGAPVAGSQTSLGCTAGAVSCDFDVQVALNVAQPEFNTGSAEIDGGASGLKIPSGALLLAIDAQDSAASADATPAPHSASTKTPATATRLLWQQAITAGNVTGLAVHPSGDLIVTGSSATAASVYDLAADQPLVRWGAGSTPNGSPDSGVPDAPAIGADGTIYVASSIANIYALAIDGGVQWASATAASFFAVAPAVDNAAWTDGGTVEQVLVPDNDATTKRLWGASATVNTPAHSSTTANVDGTSPPIVLGDNVWFGTGVGTAGGVESHPLNNDGTLGARSSVAGLQTRPYLGVITDGTSIFAATNRGSGSTTRLDLYSINPGTGATNWDATTAHLSAEPTLGIDGFLYASSFAATNKASTVNVATGTFTSLLTLPSATGLTPLQGSDGHWYLPSTTGHLDALVNVGSPAVATRSWSFDAPGAILGDAVLDCQGRLFVAAGNTVYAFVTDDRGLADT